MNNRLQPILLQKQREVSIVKEQLAVDTKHPLHHILQRNQVCPSRFKDTLRGQSLAVIAEIKRKSPSKGALATIKNPVALAQTYIAGGASAISVLTDEHFFGGGLTDLSQVASTLVTTPILRKDFIIDKLQIAEAILAGASAILCIVAVLGKTTRTMLAMAKTMGIEVLVEVHNEHELDIALTSGAEIIGVNNRDLTTMKIDPEQSLRLIEQIPSAVVRVAESGILLPTLAQDYYRAGFDAVLIGEALVTSADPGEFIRACRHG